MDGMQVIIGIVLSTVIFVGLMFILREVFSWYWKINIHLENQEKIISLLDDIQRNTNNKIKSI